MTESVKPTDPMVNNTQEVPMQQEPFQEILIPRNASQTFSIQQEKPTIQLYPFKSIQLRGSRSNSLSSQHSLNSSRRGSVSTTAYNYTSSNQTQRSMGALRDTKSSILGSRDSNDILGSPPQTTFMTEAKDEVHELTLETARSKSPAIPAPSSRRNSLIISHDSKKALSSRRASNASSAKIKIISRTNSMHSKEEGVDREVIMSDFDLNQLKQNDSKDMDYFDYIKNSQRINSSMNFIQKVDSNDIPWLDSKKIKMIGRYLVGDQIGKGSFGKVKEGICSETLLRVAIKIIVKKRAKRNTEGVGGIVKEIKMLRRLKHENIITVIDVYCKVEDETGATGVFPWFETIEDDPITWIYADGSTQEKKVTVVKYYIVLQYCPWTLQSLLEAAPESKLPIDRAH